MGGLSGRGDVGVGAMGVSQKDLGELEGGLCERAAAPPERGEGEGREV